MDRKLIIIVICLSASLLAGGFALAWKNKDALLASLRVGNASGRQWIDIKPRTDPKDAIATPKAKAVKKSGVKNPATPQMSIVASNWTPSQKRGDRSKADFLASTAKKPAPEVLWCPFPGAKAKVPAVIINEVAWMGTDKSHTDEWIELKNLYRDEVDIGGWQLQNKDRGIKVVFKPGSVLPAGGFYLLERTDDTTIPAVVADAIYTGNLANSNEALYLFDADCGLQDSVAAQPSWPAGDNAGKRTMERTGDLLWRTSVKAGGTPRQENSVY